MLHCLLLTIFTGHFTGERSVFCFKESGKLKFMKKLDFNPSCIHAYSILPGIQRTHTTSHPCLQHTPRYPAYSYHKPSMPTAYSQVSSVLIPQAIHAYSILPGIQHTHTTSHPCLQHTPRYPAYSYHKPSMPTAYSQVSSILIPQAIHAYSILPGIQHTHTTSHPCLQHTPRYPAYSYHKPSMPTAYSQVSSVLIPQAIHAYSILPGIQRTHTTSHPCLQHTPRYPAYSYHKPSMPTAPGIQRTHTISHPCLDRYVRLLVDHLRI